MRQHPDEILEGLDAEQREAATALHGPVSILAGAGTGKTRAITHRIAYGVATGVFNPHQTLALTFTKRAASEMRSRLRDLGADGVQARTFHSAALRQLQYFWPEAIGGTMHQLIDHKANLIIEAASTRLRMHTDRATVRDLAGEIEWAKVSMLTPESYAEKAIDRTFPAGWDHRSATRLFQAYEDLKKERRVIDFDDVLLLMVGILESEPRIAARVHQQYRTFIVDEYQDVSPLQQRLLDAWLGGREELCVVGDTSQTIYSFNGATSEFLTDFTLRYPNATRVKLIRDYRSTPQIVRLANQVLEERTTMTVDEQGRKLPRWPQPLELISQRESGPEPVIASSPDEDAEASWVADQIQELTHPTQPGPDGTLPAPVEPQNIAVLYRTNAQSLTFERALNDRNMSYQLRGAEGFFSRREVKEATLQLRAAAPASQDVRGADVVGLVKDILSSLGYTSDAPAVSGAVREKWESLDSLVNLTEDLARSRGPEFQLGDLVSELVERQEFDNAPVQGGVTLASLHSAKGLEWDVVFLVGLHEGLMPISFAKEPEEIDEERRLFYVGITRARDRLFLSWSQARSQGQRSTRSPSRFVVPLLPRAGATRARGGYGHQGGGARGTQRRARASGKVATCKSCGAVLETAAERKLKRCANCPATYDEQLFEQLKEWRAATAKEAAMPAFVIFTDATLVAIAENTPRTERELRMIPGVGAVKWERYGTQILDLVEKAAGS